MGRRNTEAVKIRLRIPSIAHSFFNVISHQNLELPYYEFDREEGWCNHTCILQQKKVIHCKSNFKTGRNYIGAEQNTLSKKSTNSFSGTSKDYLVNRFFMILYQEIVLLWIPSVSRDIISNKCGIRDRILSHIFISVHSVIPIIIIILYNFIWL
jgi:hypothetical protein